MKSILSMSSKMARDYLLKPESYSNVELPIYFNFGNIIQHILKLTDGKNMCDFYNEQIKPQDLDDVNYVIVKNKNGKYDWRPIELMHPFIYIQLVETITSRENWEFIRNRFKQYRKNKRINCCSIPGESATKKHDKKANIYNWINNVEQKSIKLGLNYKYMATTDISNCYASIYTHVVSWALYTREEAKKKEKRTNKKLLGNIIDELLRKMNYNQTNGIPQGSVLTDFIAEIILGYADELLTDKLNNFNIDYQIIRYRDDYRIFANNELELNIILKALTEVLSDLNFKLNVTKTEITDNIIKSSMKQDKYELLSLFINPNLILEQKLLILKQISDDYHSDSRIKFLLTDLYEKEIKNLKKKPRHYAEIISIIVDIMLNKPGLYNISIAILSELFKSLSKDEKKYFIDLIIKKFKNTPNTEYLNIWLQRLTIVSDKERDYDCNICKKVYDMETKIWNSSWLNVDIKEESIIDLEVLSKISPVISSEEVDRFNIDGYMNS